MFIEFFEKIFENDPTVKRHLAKTISWRLLGTFDTVALAWLITGKIEIGAKIGGIELITKMVLYFLHERVWHRVLFGQPSRRKKAEDTKKEIAANLFYQTAKVSKERREELNGNRSFTLWLTGLSASGKSTIANEVDAWFFNAGIGSYLIDGDNTRLGINSDLSFSDEDRRENIRRVAEICKLFNDAGTIVIASFISPFAQDREMARSIIGLGNFIETFVDAPLHICKQRDVKGLYKKAEDGKIKNFTGVNSPYEKPELPAIHLNAHEDSAEMCRDRIIDFLVSKKIVVAVETFN